MVHGTELQSTINKVLVAISRQMREEYRKAGGQQAGGSEPDRCGRVTFLIDILTHLGVRCNGGRRKPNRL